MNHIDSLEITLDSGFVYFKINQREDEFEIGLDKDDVDDLISLLELLKSKLD
jgi:hypothetical protein